MILMTLFVLATTLTALDEAVRQNQNMVYTVCKFDSRSFAALEVKLIESW
jgi:hypothetical protein